MVVVVLVLGPFLTKLIFFGPLMVGGVCISYDREIFGHADSPKDVAILRTLRRCNT